MLLDESALETPNEDIAEAGRYGAPTSISGFPRGWDDESKNASGLVRRLRSSLWRACNVARRENDR